LEKILEKWKNIKWKWPLIILILFILAFGVPIGINESYKLNKGYLTLWNASDVLSFYGNFLAFCGTVALGYSAINQNRFIIETQIKSQSYSSYRISTLSIQEYIDRPSTEFYPSESKASSATKLKKSVSFMFIEEGLVPAFKIQIMYFEITYKNSSEVVVTYSTTNKEYQILRNLRGNEEKQVGTNVIAYFEESYLNKLLAADRFTISMKIKYLNGFKVETIGEYRALMKPAKDSNGKKRLYIAEYSVCDNESYLIKKGEV
jgi:hypothetical protein